NAAQGNARPLISKGSHIPLVPAWDLCPRTIYGICRNTCAGVQNFRSGSTRALLQPGSRILLCSKLIRLWMHPNGSRLDPGCASCVAQKDLIRATVTPDSSLVDPHPGSIFL